MESPSKSQLESASPARVRTSKQESQTVEPESLTKILCFSVLCCLSRHLCQERKRKRKAFHAGNTIDKKAQSWDCALYPKANHLSSISWGKKRNKSHMWFFYAQKISGITVKKFNSDYLLETEIEERGEMGRVFLLFILYYPNVRKFCLWSLRQFHTVLLKKKRKKRDSSLIVPTIPLGNSC